MRGATLRSAIYARVSSEQQAQAGTIESQVEALRKRVIEDGLELESELEFVDAGFSGSTLVRPALEKLRDMAAAGCLDRLYVHSPDRLSRKYAYQVLLVDELKRSGVEILFLNHGVGDSPEDSLLLQVQGMVAEYERAKIQERCRRGKLHAARNGKISALGDAPYGYRYVPIHEGGGQASYEILLDEAKVVRQIFEWVGIEGCSVGQVCKRLQDSEIPTKKGKRFWDSSTVWGMLKNPAYKGMAAFGKTRLGERRPRVRPQRGALEQPRRNYSTYDVPKEKWTHIPVPAIIGEDLFEVVQEKLAENRARYRERLRGPSHLLQGLVVCGRCGYAYHGVRASKVTNGKRYSYTYYKCGGTNSSHFGGQKVCSNETVCGDTLEQAVWEDVSSLLSDPQRIEQEYQRRLAEKPREYWGGAEQLRQTILKIRRGMSRLIDSYQEGLLEKEDFEPRMRKAKERLRRLETDLERCIDEEEQRRSLRLVIGRMREFANTVTDGLTNADWETRRALIRAVVKRVEIGDKDVRIVYKISPDTPARERQEKILQHRWRHLDTPLKRSILPDNDEIRRDSR
jgi:site-specific DNA recombinase